MRDDAPSATARLIARSMVLLSHEPKLAPLVPPQAAEVSTWFLDDRFVRLCRHGWFRAVIFAVERRTLPGILIHYALRKRRLEEIARDALNAGVRQVVVLGAGFDSLCLRLHTEYPDVTFLEMDHPATQGVKRKAVTAQGVIRPNLLLCPLDLGHASLAEALSSIPEYHSSHPALFIAEGLTMYLTTEQIQNLFDQARERSRPGSRFAFTFLEPQDDGRVNFNAPSKGVDAWLKHRGEPFQWGVHRADLSDLLHSVGWILEGMATPEGLRQDYGLSAIRRVNGDVVAVAHAVP